MKIKGQDSLKCPHYSWGADNRGKDYAPPGYAENDGGKGQSKLNLNPETKFKQSTDAGK